MSVLIRTESGATYERDGDRIRRLEGASENPKRRDGHWLRLHRMLPREPKIGAPMVLVLESLAAHGPDDHGTTTPDPDYTTRMTTPVASIQEDA